MGQHADEFFVGGALGAFQLLGQLLHQQEVAGEAAVEELTALGAVAAAVCVREQARAAGLQRIQLRQQLQAA